MKEINKLIWSKHIDMTEDEKEAAIQKIQESPFVDDREQAENWMLHVLRTQMNKNKITSNRSSDGRFTKS